MGFVFLGGQKRPTWERLWEHGALFRIRFEYWSLRYDAPGSLARAIFITSGLLVNVGLGASG